MGVPAARRDHVPREQYHVPEMVRGQGKTGEGKADGRIIDRFSPECTALWENSAREFVGRIRAAAPELKPVIIETFLCETVGDITGTEPFPEGDEIRRMNALLSRYYSLLESLWPEALVLRPAADPLYFTDRKFEYGAIPSHINELFNQRLAEEIERRGGRGTRELK